MGAKKLLLAFTGIESQCHSSKDHFHYFSKAIESREKVKSFTKNSMQFKIDIQNETTKIQPKNRNSDMKENK
jgi:hypothetical protein